MAIPSSKGLRRLGAVLGSGALSLLLLTGCAGNFGAQTNKPYEPADGISVRRHQLSALNSLVVVGNGGNGTLVAGLVNKTATPDTLQSVTAMRPNSQQQIKVTYKSGSVKIPPSTLVQLKGQVRLHAKSFTPGDLVKVTYTFADAAPITVTIPLMGHQAPYATIPVGGQRS